MNKDIDKVGLSADFNHRLMQELVYEMQIDSHRFLETIKEANLSVLEGGNLKMKKRVLEPGFKQAANPDLSRVAVMLRAYPDAARKLFLWAQELSEGVPDNHASIKSDDPIMEFFASIGFLNERATGPANSIFNILGLEVPERQNRVRTERREHLLQMQNAYS